MIDIYDIKTITFWFLYSWDYLFLIFWIVFLVSFYFLITYFFWFQYHMSKKIETISDESIRKRFAYLVENRESLPRNIFYREVSIFLKMLVYKEIKDKSIFFMTLSEIEKNIQNKYNALLKEVYYLEFDGQSEDNLEIRKNILQNLI